MRRIRTIIRAMQWLTKPVSDDIRIVHYHFNGEWIPQHLPGDVTDEQLDDIYGEGQWRE